MQQTHDDRGASTVLVEIAHGVAHRIIPLQTAELPLKIAEAADGGGLIDGPAQRPPKKCGDRRGHPSDGADTTGNFLDINTGIRRSNWHNLFPLSSVLISIAYEPGPGQPRATRPQDSRLNQLAAVINPPVSSTISIHQPARYQALQSGFHIRRRGPGALMTQPPLRDPFQRIFGPGVVAQIPQTVGFKCQLGLSRIGCGDCLSLAAHVPWLKTSNSRCSQKNSGRICPPPFFGHSNNEAFHQRIPAG